MCLILFYVVKNLPKEPIDEAFTLLQDDKRIQTLMDMLLARIPDMEVDYIITTIWSLGILVSGFSYEGITPE